MTLRKYITKIRLLLGIFSILFIANVAVGAILISQNLPQVLFYTHLTPKVTSTERKILDQIQTIKTFKDFTQLRTTAFPYTKITSTIEVGNCNPYPHFVSVSIDSPLTFINSDSKVHLIIIGPHYLHILPHTSQTVLLDFYNYAPSLQAYSCDHNTSFSGALVVLPHANPVLHQ